MKVRLFDNNYTVVPATTLADLNEATAMTGYVAAAPTWSTPAVVSGVPTTTPVPSGVVFTYSGVSTYTVYGAYLTDSANTKLWGASNFAAPFVFSVTVLTLSIYPTYTQKAEFTTS